MENREKSKKPVVKLGTKSSHAAYFMPMLESFAARDDLNEVIKNRVSKACDLLDAGVPRGPEIGRNLQKALELVLKDQSKNRKDILLNELGVAGRN